jgi:hypothetical protein
MDTTPGAIVRYADAQLPGAYERAREALALCDRIDECHAWADKAAALASYAKQAKDPEMLNMLRRIQARATRRAGELLKTFQHKGSGAGRPSNKSTAGAHGRLSESTQLQAARAAGMSEHQERVARNAAMIPAEEFEAAIAAPIAPTLSTLTRPRKGNRSAPRPPSAPLRGKGATTDAARAARLDTIREMAGEGCNSIQIGAAVGVSAGYCRGLMRREGIECPADRMLGQARRLDPNRVMDHLVESLADIQTDAPSINLAALDPARLPAWIASLALSHRALSVLLGRLKRSAPYDTTQAHPAHLENPPRADQTDVDGA